MFFLLTLSVLSLILKTISSFVSLSPRYPIISTDQKCNKCWLELSGYGSDFHLSNTEVIQRRMVFLKELSRLQHGKV